MVRTYLNILKKDEIFNLFIIMLVFFMSLWLLNYYLLGDQIHYIATYEALSNMTLKEGYSYYNNALSSKEFIHFILSWLLSSYINKDLFIAIANVFLAYFTSKLLIKWRVNFFIIFLIVVFNFYFIVLYTSAERLKFGVLFMIISFYYLEDKKKFIFFSMLSIMAHTQIIIIYGSIVFYTFIKQIFYTIKSNKIKKSFFYAIFLFFVTLILIHEQLIDKFNAYFSINSISELYQCLMLFCLSLMYSKNRSQTITIFLVLAVIILLVGGTRVNMLAYFVFLFYGLQFRNGLNIGVLTTSIYFFLKSIPFLYCVYTCGDGFCKDLIF